MIKLRLIAEIDAETNEEAEAKLDAFREAVQPSSEYGIALYLEEPEGQWRQRTNAPNRTREKG